MRLWRLFLGIGLGRATRLPPRALGKKKHYFLRKIISTCPSRRMDLPFSDVAELPKACFEFAQ